MERVRLRHPSTSSLSRHRDTSIINVVAPKGATARAALSSRSPLELIRKRPLAKRLKVSPWTIDRWRKLGKFPAPIRLSEIVLAWRVADVEAWLRTRADIQT